MEKKETIETRDRNETETLFIKAKVTRWLYCADNIRYAGNLCVLSVGEYNQLCKEKGAAGAEQEQWRRRAEIAALYLEDFHRFYECARESLGWNHPDFEASSGADDWMLANLPESTEEDRS
jgi:hypothetical protein